LQTVTDRHLPPGKNLEEEEVVILALETLKQQLNVCSFQVLWLRLIEQRSVPEVAQVLGLSHEQVWYRFHRARRELEQICAALMSGDCARRSALSPIDEKNEKCTNSAQGTSPFSVSRIVGTNPFGRRGGTCVDYVFQRLELGRRELNPEWKVEWNCNGGPTPVLYIRRTAMVAYAEICGSVETVAANWPRIVQAAIAAGGLAGIATIIATPTLALPVFHKEFHKQLHGKGGCPVEEEIRIALSAKQEANGPWCECKS